MAEYIKREDVIWITAETGALETQGRVRDLPAADVRHVVRGKWKHTVGVSYRCSACGKETYMGERMNYCPNCGADMR